MMRYLDIARVVVQAATPLSIASGKADVQHDVVLVRDAFGLPAIPGAALAGVLRAGFQRKHGAEATAWLFGQAKAKDVSGTEQETAPKPREREKSRISFSWAAVHNKDNKPVDGPVTAFPDIVGDPLLSLLVALQPVNRDHVALTERGVTDDTKKFDRGAVPTGTRFTFEMSIERAEGEKARLGDLLDLLKEGIVVGGAGRGGYGAVHLVVARHTTLDLKQKSDLASLRGLRGSLAGSIPKSWQSTVQQQQRKKPSAFTLTLKAQDFWRTGEGGKVVEGKNGVRPAKTQPQAVPALEKVVKWTADKALVEDRLVLPASGIKGALRHRTLFHLRRIALPAGGEEPAAGALDPLFGGIKGAGRKGNAGRLFLSNVYLKPDDELTAIMHHNGIDRFTGGVRTGVLFSEQLIYQSSLVLSGHIDDADAVPANVKRAFRMALDDLAEGRLALGAAAAKGHGYFEGGVEGGELSNGHWLSAEAPK